MLLVSFCFESQIDSYPLEAFFSGSCDTCFASSFALRLARLRSRALICEVLTAICCLTKSATELCVWCKREPDEKRDLKLYVCL